MGDILWLHGCFVFLGVVASADTPWVHDATTFIGVIAGASIPSFVAYKQATRVSRETNRVEVAKVDASAYERAKQLYESGIASLEAQLKHLRESLDEERTISTQLRVQVNTLELTVARMRREMELAGIEINTSSYLS